MPVKIVPTETNDPREISLAEYTLGCENFADHYYNSANAGTEFGGKDFLVPWQPLQDAVNNYCLTNNIDPNFVANRFVLCYDQGTKQLFLRMQILKMCDPTFTAAGLEVYRLDDSVCAWYMLKENTFVETPDHTLKDEVYFNNFYYEDVMGSGNFVLLNSNPSTFVQNITYPWASELLLMYQNNNSPAGADIHFAAYSYVDPIPSTQIVTWPHGLVMYLSVGTTKLLDNNNYLCVFENKGADNGTMCPPTCGVYVNPVLPQTKN